MGEFFQERFKGNAKRCHYRLWLWVISGSIGKYPDIAKTLSGFGGASVIELVQDHKGDTFRAVYTIKFADAIIVLHAFQKKSKRGIDTPKQDIELIRSRLKLAEEIYKEWKRKGDKSNG